jgi:mediator of RNA polymerase II transcription subunit 13
LRDIHNCNMRSFLEIPGIPVLNQGLRLPPRPIVNPRGPNSVDAARFNNPFQIPPPQLEVRRSESKLSVLPTAITFWENLGLGPSNGPKDVNAICVYPNFDGVAANADIFLEQMRSIYECSRLGNHDRLIANDLPAGLMPFTVEPAQQNKFHHLSALKDVTSRLSRILSSAPVEERNFVVYFIYPTDNGALLVHICSAFQHLFNMYRKTLSEKRATFANELVLQLIPLDFISSSTSLSVPLPSEYFRLAIEVYDRCIDFTSSSSTPAIMLEQPLPKTIDFRLNANPSASLLQENTCLHVAYAQSIDDRWITAAWTDNRGTQQMTASYCLGRKNEPISMPFSDVANEIWETTLDFIARKKIHWRIMIARVGVMDPSEMDFWIGLASTESDTQVNLTLITVQTDPSLRLLPASIILSPNGNTANSVVTPVSTPQALQSSIVSPGDAATPVDGPVEPDSDARLIDSTDQSWGAVLSHRLNNSNSLMELNPALISGYLIKRGGVNSDDPPIIMEVNIVYGEVIGNPRTFHECLLKEILGYYRGLGTLARVRGLVNSVGDARPWHVAAAEKAVKALYMLM